MGGNGGVDAHQHVTHRLLKDLGARRQLHSLANQYQQRVVEIMAKPPERPAHGRLAHMQALGSPADAGVFQQGVEGYQHVQIHFFKRMG